ncbi:MAG: hypothetical protein KZQ62_01535, partial [Candidatus Thiodiazotropha sp. (ex Lucinoma aequizonata)]|nr:hypothetical protein [Candidatus Thiodiazotropha sp. (ex Lucinoma aequizonata)]
VLKSLRLASFICFAASLSLIASAIASSCSTGNAEFEQSICFMQGFELVIGGIYFLVGIAFFHSALAIDVWDRKEAGAVKVDLGIKVPAAEVVELWSPSAGDVIIVQVFTDHGAIL